MNKFIVILLLLTINAIYKAEEVKVYSFDSFGKVTLKCKTSIKTVADKRINRYEGTLGGDYRKKKYSLCDEANRTIWKKQVLLPPLGFPDHIAGGLPYFKIYVIRAIEGRLYIVYNEDNELYIEVLQMINSSWEQHKLINASNHVAFTVRVCKIEENRESLRLFISGDKVKEKASLKISNEDGSISLNTRLYPTNSSLKKNLSQPSTANKVLEQGNKGEPNQLKLLWFACIVLTVSLIIQLRKAHKVRK